eukprot:UN34672
MSTDHVYDGNLKNNSKYIETHPCAPLNQYGKTKRKFEELLRNTWTQHLIFRSSIIYGPKPTRQCKKTGTLLQFVTSKFDSEKEWIIFSDEIRNFIHINDVIKVFRFFLKEICLSLVEKRMFNKWGFYNLGGPEPLSRAEFATQIFKFHNKDPKNMKAVPRSQCKEDWAHTCQQPRNLSMSINRIQTDTKFKIKTLSENLKNMENTSKTKKIIQTIEKINIHGLMYPKIKTSNLWMKLLQKRLVSRNQIIVLKNKCGSKNIF